MKKVVETYCTASPSSVQVENMGPGGTGAKHLGWEDRCFQVFQEAYSAQDSSLEGLKPHARAWIPNHFHSIEPVSLTILTSADYVGPKDLDLAIYPGRPDTKAHHPNRGRQPVPAQISQRRSCSEITNVLQHQKRLSWNGTKPGRAWRRDMCSLL